MYNYIQFDTRFFDDFADVIEKISSDSELKKIISQGLRESKNEINQNIDKALVKPHMPAKGKYSKGWAKKGVSRDGKVMWTGSVGKIKIGFDSSTGNIDPKKGQVLIHGKPTQKPVIGLYDAIFGEDNADIVEKHCRNALNDYIEQKFKNEV